MAGGGGGAGGGTAQLSQAVTPTPLSKATWLSLGQLPAAGLVKLSAHKDPPGKGSEGRFQSR